MPPAKVNTFVWLDAHHAQALRDLAADNALGERAWISEQRRAAGLFDSEPTPPDIRMEALALRPDNWPGESLLAESAIRRRLASADLAGPWAPFTKREREMQRLSGRRTGSPNQRFGETMALDIDAELVASMQLAAYRISEPIIAQLRAEHLIGPRPRRSKDAQRRKQELQAEIFTVGRIIRESIALLTVT